MEQQPYHETIRSESKQCVLGTSMDLCFFSRFDILYPHPYIIPFIPFIHSIDMCTHTHTHTHTIEFTASRSRITNTIARYYTKYS